MANVVRYLTGYEGWPTGTPPTAGGGLSSGVTGTPTVGATYARPGSGAQGLQANPVAAPDESWNAPTLSGQAVAAVSLWAKAVTLDTSSAYSVLAVGDGGFANYGSIGINTSNQWCAGWNADFGNFRAGPSVETGVWTLLELLVDMHANPWTARWRINGSEDLTAPATLAVALNSFGGLGLGAFGPGNRTVELWFDDVIAVDGTDQTMFPVGPVAILAATADQAAAAEHQGITAAEWQYTDNFTSFTNFAGASETDSRSRLDDLNTSDGVRLSGAAIASKPVFRAAGAKSAGTTSAVTVAAPAGVAEADLEILIGEVSSGSTLSITSNGGGAWTAMSGSPKTVVGGRTLYIWSRIRAAGDGDPQVTASADQVCACRLAYTAGTFDASDPFDIESNSSETTSDTSYSYAPGTSTTVNNSVVLSVSTILRDSDTASVPVCSNGNLTSLASRANYCTSSGGGGGFGVTEGTRATAGAVGTFACTYSAASPKAYIAFAIKPPTVGGALTGNGRWPVADIVGRSRDPIAVRLLTATREALAGTNNVTLRTLVGASTTDHFSGDPGWGTTWTYLGSTLATKPGGGVWTTPDVNAIRFEVDGTDCFPAIWLGGFVYEVAWPADPGRQPVVVPSYAVTRAAVR